MKNLYGIFAGSRWATETNLERARALAKRELLREDVTCVHIRRMEYGRECWDAPTFHVCSDAFETISR